MEALVLGRIRELELADEARLAAELIERGQPERALLMLERVRCAVIDLCIARESSWIDTPRN